MSNDRESQFRARRHLALGALTGTISLRPIQERRALSSGVGDTTATLTLSLSARWVRRFLEAGRCPPLFYSKTVIES